MFPLDSLLPLSDTERADLRQHAEAAKTYHLGCGNWVVVGKGRTAAVALNNELLHHAAGPIAVAQVPHDEAVVLAYLASASPNMVLRLLWQVDEVDRQRGQAEARYVEQILALRNALSDAIFERNEWQQKAEHRLASADIWQQIALSDTAGLHRYLPLCPAPPILSGTSAPVLLGGQPIGTVHRVGARYFGMNAARTASGDSHDTVEQAVDDVYQWATGRSPNYVRHCVLKKEVSNGY